MPAVPLSQMRMKLYIARRMQPGGCCLTRAGTQMRAAVEGYCRDILPLQNG